MADLTTVRAKIKLALDEADAALAVPAPAQTIDLFTVSANSITAGQPVTVNWATSNATAVRLNGATVAASGSQTVAPTATTTYVLEADGSVATLSRSLSVTVTQAQQSSIDYAGMADDSWLNITNAGPSGQAEPPYNIGAYSGACYDDIHDQMLFFGGGHHDYYGNEVWSLNLADGAWLQRYQSEPFNTYSLDPTNQIVPNIDLPSPGHAGHPGMWMPSGRPISRHTSGSIGFVSNRGKMIAGGGSLYDGVNGNLWSVWGNSWADTWVFDPVANTWEYRGGSSQDNTVDPGKGHPTATAYDPATGDVYCAFYMAVNQPYGIYRYNFDADTWTHLTDFPNAGYRFEPSATFDTKRRRYLVIGGANAANAIWGYDVATNTTFNATPPTGGPNWDLSYDSGQTCGIAYDSLNDVYGIYHVNDGLWIIDPVTNTWSRASNAAWPIIGTIHGKFKYSALHNVFIVGYTNTSTYKLNAAAYRYKRATTSPSTPPPSSGLAVPLTATEGTL